jgi:drug/metabolite transporter (DMT)-like permease
MMKRWDAVAEFVVLAAVWGGSFFWMRVAAPEFGPVWLIELRLVLASAVLVPLVLRQGLWSVGLTHWRHLLVVGGLNSALPFVLLAYATLWLPAGFTSILNATAPLFGTGIALVWLKERHSVGQLVGLGMGFMGVVILLGWQPTLGTEGFWPAVVAGLGAACCYAIAAPYVRRHLAQVPALVIATGSLVGAALVLLPVLPVTVPQAVPSPQSMGALVALALLSTALAYLLYFRLIAHLGSTRALTVGYLIPMFAMGWGVLWLGEAVTASMGLGCGLVLLGTAIANRPVPPTPVPSLVAPKPDIPQ